MCEGIRIVYSIVINEERVSVKGNMVGEVGVFYMFVFWEKLFKVIFMDVFKDVYIGLGILGLFLYISMNFNVILV